MNDEITSAMIRGWVLKGIRRYKQSVQDGAGGDEAIDTAAWSILESETFESDRIVRLGLGYYIGAVDDGVWDEDAKQAAVARATDDVMGEQMVRRLHAAGERNGLVYWQSPEVIVRKADVVDLIGRLAERLVGLGDEFPFVFEGYLKEGSDGSEN